MPLLKNNKKMIIFKNYLTQYQRKLMMEKI